MPPYFFGYGSLVNRSTHDYAQARPACLRGWQRVWVQTPARPAAYLSVQPISYGMIEGLVAHVPNDWASLDLREAAYTRQTVKTDLADGTIQSAQVYAVPHGDPAGPDHFIVLSYLDAVVQGFLREFGAEGASRFFASTKGWNAPILNDRANPQYPRAQLLSARERLSVDAGLASVGVSL